MQTGRNCTHSFGLLIVGHEEPGAHPDALRTARRESDPGVNAHSVPVAAQHVARRRRHQTAPHRMRQGLGVRRQHVVHAHQLQQRRQNLTQLHVCKCKIRFNLNSMERGLIF